MKYVVVECRENGYGEKAFAEKADAMAYGDQKAVEYAEEIVNLFLIEAEDDVDDIFGMDSSFVWLRNLDNSFEEDLIN